MSNSKRASPSSMFNFMIVKQLEDGATIIKKYHTKAEIKQDYNMSAMTIHRILTNPDHKVIKRYSDLTITRIREPARKVVQLNF